MEKEDSAPLAKDEKVIGRVLDHVPIVFVFFFLKNLAYSTSQSRHRADCSAQALWRPVAEGSRMAQT